MNIKEKKNIKLLNYNSSIVSLPTPRGNKIMDGADGDKPFADYFSWDEIEYIYNRSAAITSTLIEPEVDDRTDFYEALRMLDWKSTMWFHDTIEDVINNPSSANMEKIVAVTNLQIIDRIRGRMIGYMNTGRGLDSRFISVVNRRYDEISAGKRQSDIVIKPVNTPIMATSAEIEDIRSQNEMLQLQLAEMKKMIEAQAVVSQNTVQSNTSANAPPVSTVQTPKPTNQFNHNKK